MVNLRVKKKNEFIILNRGKLITLGKFKEYYAKKEYKVQIITLGNF